MTLNGLHIQISACKSGVNREPKATKVPAKHSSGGGAFNAIPRQTTHSDDCRQAEKLLMYAFNAIPRQYQCICVRVGREGIYFCIYFTFSLSHQCALEASAYTYYCILFSVFSFCVCIRLSYCMVCSVCCVSSFYSFLCMRMFSLE